MTHALRDRIMCEACEYLRGKKAKPAKTVAYGSMEALVCRYILNVGPPVTRSSRHVFVGMLIA
jgi:hypothetical protein